MRVLRDAAWRTRSARRRVATEDACPFEQLYVHYGYCERVNDAEDACIEYFADHVSEAALASLRDTIRVMPFANLEFPRGNSKTHGIRGARASKAPVFVSAAASTSQPPDGWLVPAPPQLLEGSDVFVGLDATVVDFWRWAFSDLRDNTARGVLAEFLVASALGRTDTRRKGWDNFDVQTATGVRVEVKASGYLQSWGAGEALSPGLRPRGRTHVG